MAYEKHTWTCGEKITDALMNHIEDGIANASSSDILVVTLTTTTWEGCDESTGDDGQILTFSHSLSEIYDSVTSGVPVFIMDGNAVRMVEAATNDDSTGEYILHTTGWTYKFDNATDKVIRLCDVK